MDGDIYLYLCRRFFVMRSIQRIFFALLFPVLLPVILQAQEKQYHVVSAGFYNLENLYDTLNDPNRNDEEFLPEGDKRYTGKIYLEKLDRLAEVISKLAVETTPDGPALLGVAEIENRSVLKDLTAHPLLASRGYRISHFDSPDMRGVDVGLLYNPKYFVPIASHAINPQIQNESGNYIKTRDILWVEGYLMGEKIHVFVGHWPSRRGGEEASSPLRQQAAARCKHTIDSIKVAEPGAKALIMGDLNDDPLSPSIKKVLNAVGKTEKLTEDHMFNPFEPFYKKGIGSLAWQDSWNLFDQVIFTPSWVTTPQEGWFFSKAEVFNRPFLTQKTGNFKGYPLRTYVGNEYQGGYSDHFPVLVYLLREKK